jgi:hypothetical protein
VDRTRGVLSFLVKSLAKNLSSASSIMRPLTLSSWLSANACANPARIAKSVNERPDWPRSTMKVVRSALGDVEERESVVAPADSSNCSAGTDIAPAAARRAMCWAWVHRMMMQCVRKCRGGENRWMHAAR